MSESNVQKYLIKECKKIGGIAVKVDCTSRRGWPDMIMIRTDREPALVEVKSDSGLGRLSDAQIMLHDKLRSMGTPVWVVSSKAEVDDLLHG